MSREVNILVLCNYQNMLLNRLLLTIKVGINLNVLYLHKWWSDWCVFPFLVIKTNILISGLVKIKFMWCSGCSINNQHYIIVFSFSFKLAVLLYLCTLVFLLANAWYVYWPIFIACFIHLVHVFSLSRPLLFESRNLKVLCGFLESVGMNTCLLSYNVSNFVSR